MGWLWATPSPAKGTDEVKAVPAQVQAPSTATHVESEYSDPELAKFMAQLQAELSPKRTEPAATSTPPPPPQPPSSSASSEAAASTTSYSWSSLWGSSTQSSAQPDPPTKPTPTNTPQGLNGTPLLDPVTESLLPTTMSCRDAFDSAFYCQSLGGQWNAVYRQGEVRSCNDHWEDFWFCMRTRTHSGPVKEAAIRDYYRAKELAKYGPGKPSSTDVWEARTEKVPVGSAFNQPIQSPDISDEEWRVLEIQRRRQVQQQQAAAEIEGGQDT